MYVVRLVVVESVPGPAGTKPPVTLCGVCVGSFRAVFCIGAVFGDLEGAYFVLTSLIWTTLSTHPRDPPGVRPHYP